MSNVFSRNRKPTGLEYSDIRIDLLRELRRVTGNSNIFPKRTLYTDVVPLIKLFDEMSYYIDKAQTRFPVNESALKERKEYIQLSIEAGEALFRKLQDCVWAIESVTPDRVEQVGILLLKELNLLRGWKKNCKIQKNGN